MAKNNYFLYSFLLIIIIYGCLKYSSTLIEKKDSSVNVTNILKEDIQKPIIIRDTIRIIEKVPVKINEPVKVEDIRKKIQEAYTKELHVRELTGNNDGERVEEYLKTVKLKKGQPWCAAFVASIFYWNGVQAPLSGWSPSWFPDTNVIWSRINGGIEPKTGDVGGLYYQSKGRIAHVFFIDDWGKQDANFVITVEGNTSLKGDREGQGVEKLRRFKKEIFKVSKWIKDS